MDAADAMVGRRVRQFRTTEEKRLIVEETRRAGVSVATVARAHGVNANPGVLLAQAVCGGTAGEHGCAGPPRYGTASCAVVAGRR